MSDRELLSALSDMLDKKLDARLKPIEESISSMKADIDSMKTEINFMKADINSIKAELQQVKLFQENVILPRLNTIESCYLDTYERYARAAEKMESAYEDVQLLKKVTEKHSQQIQELQQAVNG